MLSFSNGNVINLGNIKGTKGDKGDTGLKGADGINGTNGVDGVGIQNVDVSADGALTVTLTNGTVLNLGNIKGADGLGITKSEINASGELVLTYSNGDIKNLGKVTGENGANGANGADGRGIKSLTLSPDGELVVVMSDNSISNLGNINGEKGDKGLQGERGADGRGIAKMSFNSNGELIVEYTDNTQDNLGKISDSTSENIDVNFTYYKYNGGYQLVASDIGKGQKVLAIPRTYEGYPIICLGAGGSYAFGKCYDLIQITIPSNIVMLVTEPSGLFAYCPKLREEGIIFEGGFTTWKDVNTYNSNTGLYYKNTDGTYTYAGKSSSIEFGEGAEYALYFDDENELKKALLGKEFYMVAVPVKKTYDPNAENLYVRGKQGLGLGSTYIKEAKKG